MEFMHEDDTPHTKSARYVTQGRLGEGTFGEVRMGHDTFTGKRVAMKFIRIMSQERGGIPRAVFRELESLRQLGGSDHVAQLLDYYPDENNLCLILEYLPSDLYEIIQKATCPLPVPQVKALAQMLLRAVSHCHEKNIIHRDIKPANILLSDKGQLKLGDFGLARVFDPLSKASLSHQVSTRWYRAPEILFASRHYTLSMDMWSTGAVIAELFSLFPLFPGSNDIDQIFRVFQVMGSPTPDTWEGLDALPDYNKVSFPFLQPVDLKILIPTAQEADINFLKNFLCLDPAKRITAAAGNDLSYLKDYPHPCLLSQLPITSRNKTEDIKSNRLLKKTDDMDTYLKGLLA